MMPRRTATATLAIALSVAALLAGSMPAAAHTAKETFLEEIGFDQRLGEQVPVDLAFVDDESRPVRIGALLKDRPAILVMLYYKCTMLCPLMLDGVVRALKPITSLTAGKDFRVIVVSINPKETPLLAANRKELYVERYGRPGAAAGFHFLTGEESAIRTLAKTIGFRYRVEKRRDEFSHAAGIVLLTPEGKIARYYYGMDFSPKDLQLALVEASKNTVGTIVDQILLLCYHYDPTTGTYGVAILNLLRAAGFATVLCLGSFIMVMLRRDRRAAPGPGERT